MQLFASRSLMARLCEFYPMTHGTPVQTRIVRECFDSSTLNKRVLSTPELITFKTPTPESTHTASGYFYAPKNDDYKVVVQVL
jgi:hypothetical protein